MKNLILAIESSCDDTCCCLMDIYTGEIVYNRSIHQDEIHREFGGIVPNLASGAHCRAIEILREDLLKSGKMLNVGVIATTTGPGLIGSLLVGVSFAKGLAMSLGVPLLRINHLEGHAMSCFIEHEVEEVGYPYLLLLASGGNSQIVLANGIGDYKILGQTLDDAAGEALDKIAKNLGIEYPGAINMEKIALKSTNHKAFEFKDGAINSNTNDFSFSGLKTQVLRKIENLGGAENLSQEVLANLAYSAQEAVFGTLIKKIELAIKNHNLTNKIKTLVVCGGVSANKRLSELVSATAKKHDLQVVVPSLQYTTDNAVMIAKVAQLRWNKTRANTGYNVMDYSFAPKARWTLEEIEK